MKGFTLVEVLVAISILAISAGLIFTLFHAMVTLVPESSSRLEAYYLAQEGVEIARNVRDTNFAKIVAAEPGINWLDGLDACEAGCEADYKSEGLVPTTDRFLLFSGGFYEYGGSGEETRFKRTISVDPEGGDPLTATKADVEVQVSWEERGRTHTVQVSTQIHNWLEF